MPCHTWKCAPTAVSSGVDISEIPGCHLLLQKSSRWGSRKLLQGLVSHELTGYFSIFNQFLLQWIKLSWHSFSMWDWLGWINLFWQFICDSLSSINLKGFYYLRAWSCCLCETRTSFCTRLISREPCRFLLMFFTGFNLLSVLLLFPLSITFFISVHSFGFYFN